MLDPITHKPRSEFTPIGELLDEPPAEIDYVVDDLLPAGGLSILVGPPKSGKTRLAENLAVAMAQGGEWLGRSCVGGTVLSIALEERRGFVAANLRALGARAGDPLYLWIDPVFLPDKAVGTAPRWLERFSDRYRPTLVIIDPLARLVTLRDGGNDYTDAYSRMAPFVELARSSGIHLMFVHHARKAGGDFGEQVLGSTALFASCDVSIEIHRDDVGQRWLSTTPRYGTSIEKARLDRDDDTGRISLGVTRNELKANARRDEAMAAITDSPGCTRAQVIALIGGNRRQVLQGITHLVREGFVEERPESGRKAFTLWPRHE